MELQTGEFPSWDRSPVAFIRTCVVSQFATIATTLRRPTLLTLYADACLPPLVYLGGGVTGSHPSKINPSHSDFARATRQVALRKFAITITINGLVIEHGFCGQGCNK